MVTAVTRVSFLFVILLVLSVGSVQAKSNTTTSCSSPVVEKVRPTVVLPWADAAELCQADFGKAWTDGIPPAGPDWAQRENAYGHKVQNFLRSFDYRKAVNQGGLGWLHDARWRLTGDWAGCPTATDSKDKWTNEVHPAVRIYYSPEVMEWLCTNRFPGKEVENPPPLPDGAMVIKEMHNAENLAYRPNTASEGVLGKAWIDANYDNDFDSLSWTIMTKGKQSYDGWYWGFFANTPATPDGCYKPPLTYNPPVSNVSAYSTPFDPHTGFQLQTDKCGKPLPNSKQTPPPLGPWYPTFTGSTNNISFTNAEFGNYCIYCHGSAESESTFSSLKNLLNTEIEYSYLKEVPQQPAPSVTMGINEHDRDAIAVAISAQLADMTESAEAGKGYLANKRYKAKTGVKAKADQSKASTPEFSRAPFPEYNPLNLASFEKAFPQFSGLTFDQVWKNRLPAQTWDHSVAGPDGPDQFLTSDQCLSCHEAGGSGQRLPNMVVVRDDEKQINLSERAEWSASPMGLGGRDPVFYAMLESELNRAEGETDLEKYAPCIQNTCLHCHGNMGQRQHAIDTVTPAPADDICASFEPLTDPTSNGTWTAEQRKAAGYGGEPFLLEDMKSWHGGAHPENAKYGGLGRDGISCTTCHHIADKDLGNSGVTFTGNFRVGPPDELYGPFDDGILTKPMEHSLGIKPKLGTALNKSSLCGSCHAIYLPVFDNDGKYVKSSFEQTTYLEWANSAFNEENNYVPESEWRSCQDCHMRDEFVYVDGEGKDRKVSLDKTRIANIQDNTFPEAEFEQADLDLKYRDYKRHTLYGLNAFINAYFQQFPLLLGNRQQNYMNYDTVAPLLTAREEVLLIARQATADVAISNITKTESQLSADVTIRNLGGHKLPSGVGFRRAFVEFQVLDKNGSAIWASGKTSNVGIIQDGISKSDLPSELLNSAPGTACSLNYQPHYQQITEPCQVQIYEELSKDSDGVFTTSFIHRFDEVKDNRLLPKGYRVFAEGDEQPEYCAPWCTKSNPVGEAISDPDYLGSDPTGVEGVDTVNYSLTLNAEQLKSAVSVTATLYSQATAPYFLNQRFNDAKAGPRSEHGQRLYFMQGHLNTSAKADDGSEYLKDYKLLINRASAKIK